MGVIFICIQRPSGSGRIIADLDFAFLAFLLLCVFFVCLSFFCVFCMNCHEELA